MTVINSSIIGNKVSNNVYSRGGGIFWAGLNSSGLIIDNSTYLPPSPNGAYHIDNSSAVMSNIPNQIVMWSNEKTQADIQAVRKVGNQPELWSGAVESDAAPSAFFCPLERRGGA
ncbi:MAG: hypothetical protein LUQ38_07130 [Methanotrichaceae archaeon]|nr:hypothetical protein [Methanotrichaceae archaeon]